MSSSVLTSTDSDGESTSISYDDRTVRRAMHTLLSYESKNDRSSTPPMHNDDDEDDDLHSPSLALRPSLSFKNNHARFTSNALDLAVSVWLILLI